MHDAPPRLEVLELAGSPAAMGEAFGEQCREAIGALYARRLANALEQARRYGGRAPGEEQLLELAGRCLDAARAWDPDGAAELVGIARGARLAPERVMAMNGLTDLRDALAWGGALEAAGGCTAFVVQRDRSRDGRLRCGQSWDLASDNMPFVVGVHRRPDDGPATWCVTTVGCLSLMGLNEHGIAVGTTNLRTVDARPGVPYLSALHRALRCREHADAVERVRTAPRAGGHSFWVADAHGNAAVLECTATRAHVFRVTRGAHVHTNHCQVPEHAADLEADIPYRSSRARLERMRALLEAPQDGDTLRSALADGAGGTLAICRRDFDGISTNAAIVISPEEPAAWACQGPPDRATWRSLLD